jgi:hypothetical protein
MNMKTLALLTIFAASAFAAPVNVTTTLSDTEQAAIKSAADQFNEQAKVRFDAYEAVKLAADPSYVVQTYVPLTVVQFFKQQVDQMVKGFVAFYGGQEDPADLLMKDKFRRLPEAEKIKIRAAVDAASEAQVGTKK